MEAYEPRAFRFIELLAISEWRMNSTESRGEGNRRQRNYSKRRSESRRKNCRMLRRTLTSLDLSVPMVAGRHASSSSITGETRTNCFIMCFSRVPMTRKRWFRRKAPIHRFAFGICACNFSSGKRGLSMYCGKQTHLTFRLISTSDSTKRPRLRSRSRSMREVSNFMLFRNCARPQAEGGLPKAALQIMRANPNS